MESSKIPLTTEKIKEKFVNQFDLVNYAIKRAEFYMYRDIGAALLDVENPVLQVINELASDKELVDDLEIGLEQVIEVDIEESNPLAEPLAEVTS